MSHFKLQLHKIAVSMLTERRLLRSILTVMTVFDIRAGDSFSGSIILRWGGDRKSVV